MSSTEFGNLAYLILLGGVLVFWLFVQNRDSLGKTAQAAAAWGLIFLGTIAAFGLWDDIRHTVAPRQAVFADQGQVVLPRAPDGHYYVTLDLDGTPVDFVVDTGASGIVLTREDAARAGVNPGQLHFYTQAMTANGPVQTAPVELGTLTLGPFTDTGVRAYVNDGEMQQSLLGMSYLQRFARLEISGGRMILER